jgi:hypothetical protein
MVARAFLGDQPREDRVPEPGPNGLLAFVVLRRHAAALEIATGLDQRARGGAKFYAALAEAAREEVARDRGGPIPTHALLKDIGYVGWSELLSARA